MLHRWRLNNWGRTNFLVFSFQRIRAAKEQEESKSDVAKHFCCTESTVAGSEVNCTTYLVFFGDKDCNSCCVQSKGFRYGCLYFHLRPLVWLILEPFQLPEMFAPQKQSNFTLKRQNMFFLSCCCLLSSTAIKGWKSQHLFILRALSPSRPYNWPQYLGSCYQNR